MGEIHEVFVLALSLVGFAGATPEFCSFFTVCTVFLSFLPRKNKLRKHRGVQKSMGNKVPWKTGMLTYLPVTSRALISLHCNLRGHLQRCQMPDIENSRKTAERGAEWVTVKQPKNSRKNSRNTRKKQPKNSQNSCFSGVSAVFPAVFRLFYRDPFGTPFGCFSAVFNVGHLAPL